MQLHLADTGGPVQVRVPVQVRGPVQVRVPMQVRVPVQVRATVLAFLLSAGPFPGQAAPAAPERGHAFDPGRSEFAVRVGDVEIPYRTFACFVLPGSDLGIEVVDPGRTRFEASVSEGELDSNGSGRWSWRVPTTPGPRSLRVSPAGDSSVIEVTAFVMVPRSQIVDGSLNGYRIGAYPKTPLRGLSTYERPEGFIEVTPETAEISISPHFRLGQFVCKQAGGYPKYVVLQERLLLKLELVLEKVNASGIHARTLTIMSGFRTPFYNEAIDNVANSRHVYGDAADVFIDQDGNGSMDDLNGDGVSTIEDARFLRDLVEGMGTAARFRRLVGGLASYRRTESHGPFVHIDARGHRARWGK